MTCKLITLAGRQDWPLDQGRVNWEIKEVAMAMAIAMHTYRIHTYPFGSLSTKVGSIMRLLLPSVMSPACISMAMCSATCRRTCKGVAHACWNSYNRTSAWSRPWTTEVGLCIFCHTTTAAATAAMAAHAIATLISIFPCSCMMPAAVSSVPAAGKILEPLN